LAAVLVTSLLSEILLYCLQPEIARGAISLSSWLLFLIPIVALTLLQTSSEEMLFRGYLLRGLANRFSSPFIWALLPGLLFTSLHWSSSSSAAINASVMVSIASFALLLTLLVYATGNLGAAFGAHLGNNLTGFLLISHQEGYNSFALFNARPLEGPGWTTLDAVLIASIGIACSLLTIPMLLHPRSPLKVEPDRARPGKSA
jgi:membrane protease YdiL (CAAX protease family)